jgi:hypothetical protein
VFYGNAVNQLTSNQGFLQQEQVNLQSQENSIDAVNIPAAATNLSQDQMTQSAALAALAKVLPAGKPVLEPFRIERKGRKAIREVPTMVLSETRAEARHYGFVGLSEGAYGAP